MTWNAAFTAEKQHEPAKGAKGAKGAMDANHDDDHEECACMGEMRGRIISATVASLRKTILNTAEALTEPDDPDDYDPEYVALMIDMLVAEIVCRMTPIGHEAESIAVHTRNVARAVEVFRATKRADMQ